VSEKKALQTGKKGRETISPPVPLPVKKATDGKPTEEEEDQDMASRTNG